MLTLVEDAKAKDDKLKENETNNKAEINPSKAKEAILNKLGKDSFDTLNYIEIRTIQGKDFYIFDWMWAGDVMGDWGPVVSVEDFKVYSYNSIGELRIIQ